MDKIMRNFGLLLVLALVVFLIYKHLQNVPSSQSKVVGGPFSQEVDITAGDAGGGMHFYDPASDTGGDNVTSYA